MSKAHDMSPELSPSRVTDLDGQLDADEWSYEKRYGRMFDLAVELERERNALELENRRSDDALDIARAAMVYMREAINKLARIRPDLNGPSR
jgi:hypothetical protein